MKLLREYIMRLLREEYQSHTFEPVAGDLVSNTNTGCKHYKSQGKVLGIRELDGDSGKTVVYKVTNSGDAFSPGDVLEKTLDQLSPIMKEDAETLPKNQWEILQTGDERRESVKAQLFDLVQQTYEPIGGHFKISSPDSLDRYRYWVVKDIDADPEIDVAILGKPDIAGQKLGAAANDGTPAAAMAYKEKSAQLRAGGEVGGIGNWWGEVSGKPAYAMLKSGALPVADEAKVAQLLSGDDYIFHGAHPDPDAPALFKTVKGWYTKKFGGKSSTKIILGNPA